MTVLVIAYLQACLTQALDKVRDHDDDGSVAEKVVAIALMVLLTLAALGVISRKVMDYVNGIDLGGGGVGGGG